MKKTLLPLLLVYFSIIFLGFLYNRTLVTRGAYSEYKTRGEVRKHEMLETSFGIEKELGNRSFSIDVLDISSYVLEVHDEVIGEGAVAEEGDVITVHYLARFEDGTVFDSSRSPGRSPFQFELGAGQAIAGWDEGLVGMRVGGVRTLTVPPSLGYGMNDYGSIPGGSTLTFEIELLSVFK